VEKPAEKPARKKPGRKPKAPKPEQTAVEPVEKPAPTPTLILQAPDGREVTLSDLRDRLQGLGTVYVRPDEGRAYWVRGMETGSVALW
jgi:outer membrane biosynthesis protein TonB